MKFGAEQSFELPFAGSETDALAFLRRPDWSLSQVGFLEDLQVSGDIVSATLRVGVPVMGDVTLPFRSRVVSTPEGARLEPLPLGGERAWVEVAGEADVREVRRQDALLGFTFRFLAHVDAPTDGHWGGAAFEKMAGAAARRTLERLARALPEAVQRASQTPRPLP